MPSVLDAIVSLGLKYIQSPRTNQHEAEVKQERAMSALALISNHL